MTLWRFSTLRAEDKDSSRLRTKSSRRARGGEFTKEVKGFERAEDCPVSERKRERALSNKESSSSVKGM